MATFVKNFKLQCVILCTFVLVVVIYFSVIDSIHHQKRSMLKRLIISISMQTFFLCMTIFNWFSLSSCMETVTESSSPRNSTTYGTWRSFRQVWKRSSTVSNMWRLLLAGTIVYALLAYPSWAFLVGPSPYMLTIFFFLCLGFHIQVFVGLVVVNFCVLVKNCLVGSKRFSVRGNQRWKGLAAVCYAAFIIVVGFINASQSPQVKKIAIPIKGLAKDLNELTITFLSDIHIGPTIGREKLEKLVLTVNYLHPDIVIIGGDLVDASVKKLKGAVEPLNFLKSKYGVYFVTGNHEYYTSDVENWMDTLQSLGVKILHNDKVQIPSDKRGHICLAGVDDPTADKFKYAGHGTDLDGALGPCDQNSPVILVAHQPNTAKLAIHSKHRVDLVLSGHTHGGQMFPFTIAAYLLNEYYAGLYDHGPYQHVYVSMGTVYGTFPLRFGTSCEISHITLTRIEGEEEEEVPVEVIEDKHKDSPAEDYPCPVCNG